MNDKYDVIIIGAGPAGLASAIEAKKNGAKSVLIIERDSEPGGILLQCIHNGFGSVIFNKDYPGPYYAEQFIEEAKKLQIEFLLDTMVIDLTPTKKIYATNSKFGYLKLEAKAIVLAMGCRERTRAQIRLPGDRPAGVFTAGTVQRFVNIEGYMPGNKFVILGSGDIGMIMARRLTLEGAEVKRVVEIMPHLTGLRRNYVQCLQDFNIRLDLMHTISRVIGKDRVKAVEIVKIDENFNHIEGTEEIVECDTLLLSVGLIPENELSKKAGIEIDPVTGGPYVDENMATSSPGFYAAGNVMNIYDLVDYVTKVSYIAGKNAALYSSGKIKNDTKKIKLEKDENIHSLIPHYINANEIKEKPFMLQLRVKKEFNDKISINIADGDKTIASYKENFARPAEMIVINVDGETLASSISPDCEKLTVEIKT